MSRRTNWIRLNHTGGDTRQILDNLWKEDNLRREDKGRGPKVSSVQRFYCIYTCEVEKLPQQNQRYCRHKLHWVLTLQTSHKCPCSHAMQLQDSNHTYSQTSNYGSQQMTTSTDWKKCFFARNGGQKTKPIHAKREAHPVPTKEFLRQAML